MATLDEAEVRAIDEAMAMSSPAERSARPHALVQPDNGARALLVGVTRVAEAASRAVECGLRVALRAAWDVTAREPRVVDGVVVPPGTRVLGLVLGDGRGAEQGALFIDEAAGHRVALSSLGANADDAPPPPRLSRVDRQLVSRVLRTVLEELAPTLPCTGAVCDTGGDIERALEDVRAGKAVILEMDARGPFALRVTVVLPSAWTGAAAPRLPSATRSLAEHVPEVEIDLVVELGKLALTLEQLVALRPGDLLPLSTTEKSALPVFLQGERRFTARPLAHDGRIAVEIVKNDDASPIEVVSAGGDPSRAPNERGER